MRPKPSKWRVISHIWVPRLGMFSEVPYKQWQIPLSILSLFNNFAPWSWSILLWARIPHLSLSSLLCLLSYHTGTRKDMHFDCSSIIRSLFQEQKLPRHTDLHSSFVVGMAQIIGTSQGHSWRQAWSRRMHCSHLSHPIKGKISSTTRILTMKVGWIVLFLCWRIFVPILNIDIMNWVNDYHQ